jgi:LysR family cys regulon transcriptional activator
MKLHQLRYINRVADLDLNVSAAAEALHTSQPGVSKQIRLLEKELGVPIFHRSGKRLTDITPAGQAILPRVRNILREIENIERIGDEHKDQQTGVLTIATTHAQACYTLPDAVKSFTGKFPKVKLNLKQGLPEQITELVLEGRADIVIATEAVNRAKKLVALPCYRWNRCLLVPPDHPLLKLKEPVSLANIVEYPLVTYDTAFADRSMVNRTFDDAGLVPNVVFTALDSDVIKTYVELGLGIGLVASIAFDAKRDSALRKIDIGHLFKPSTTWIGIRRSSYLRSYAYEFIEQYAPHLDRKTVKAALHLD